jgi:pimeloyl-ACP methyl ester carboxylesterase
MTNEYDQPIVILGGFLSVAAIYTQMRKALAALSGRKVFIVNTRLFDWLPSVSKLGWFLVLNKLDLSVKKALSVSGEDKATLVGHSQGGVLARLYLSPEPFMGVHFCGVDHISHLTTLGSPHLNRGGYQRGGHMSRWVQSRLPGSFFIPQVRYTSVAGSYIRGDSAGTRFERFAFGSYEQICGDGEAWGDGIVPVSSAFLPGSLQITLPGVSHYSLIGEPWYGSEEVLPLWWQPDPKTDLL